MKTYFPICFSILSLGLLFASLAMPEQTLAQRFSHPSGGSVSRAPMPVSRPVSNPAPVRRPETPVVETRPTINGGSRNFGNHDFNRSTNVNEHVNTTVTQNINVHTNVNVNEHDRDHVNVYHTGGYRGFHPYYYHPYRPYYWGPHWHPVGFFLPYLTAAAIRFSLANQWYYYDNGCFYAPSNGGYSVVPPPIGAVVSYLPEGYETLMVGNDTYYYYGGAFYIFTGQAYQVVQAPVDAVVTQLPTGAIEQDINGQVLMVYNNTYYQPISQNGVDAYEVVPVN
jgi:Family of unknown function (DUF6515)